LKNFALRFNPARKFSVRVRAVASSSHNRPGQLSSARKATMLRLKREQRALVADKVGDLANLAAAGLVFAQFVSDQPFSLWMALGGRVLVVMVAAIVAKGSQR
jgi:hypothetical protein